MPEFAAEPVTADSTVDQPSTNTASGTVDSAQAVDSTTDVAVDQQAATDGQAAVDQQAVDATEGDGRTLSPAVRKVLADIKAVDPKTAGIFRDALFRDQRLRATFPGGLPEVVKVKEALDAIGGLDGIQTIRTEAQATKAELEKIDTGFANGDTAILENIVKQSPDGFAKLMPSALDHFAKVDAEGYQHTMARVVINTLDSGPLGQAYNALAQLGQDDPQAKAIADTLAQWYNGINQLASKVPEKKVDSEREKFQTEKQQWEQQKSQEFLDSVSKEFNSYCLGQCEKALSAEFNARGLNLDALKKSDPESFQTLLSNCDAAVGRVVRQDSAFQQNLKGILATRDKARAVQFSNARADKIIADAVKKTYKAFYTMGGGKAVDTRQKTQAAQATRDIGQGAAPVKLDKMPQPEEIDRTRLPKGYRTVEDALLDGKAYLKGKKELVSF